MRKMNNIDDTKYKVNEIFYSLQGEGFYTGHAAVFIRFSGCNLKCPFCDTDFRKYTEMTKTEILLEVAKYPTDLVVFTGGEPTLQLTASLIEGIHGLHKIAAIETNGTRDVPDNIDWITVSPKNNYVSYSILKLKKANEVKVVMDDLVNYSDPTFNIEADYYYIQPCDTGDEKRNKAIIERVVKFIEDNPKYRLSLQTQKILHVR